MTRILLAKDTGDLREVLHELFANAGCTVVTTPDARAALQPGELP